jgi:hypothetical protein
MSREHVLQVIFDEDAWTTETAREYLMRHHHKEYTAKRDAGGEVADAA